MLFNFSWSKIFAYVRISRHPKNHLKSRNREDMRWLWGKTSWSNWQVIVLTNSSFYVTWSKLLHSVHIGKHCQIVPTLSELELQLQWLQLLTFFAGKLVFMSLKLEHSTILFSSTKRGLVLWKSPLDLLLQSGDVKSMPPFHCVGWLLFQISSLNSDPHWGLPWCLQLQLF